MWSGAPPCPAGPPGSHWGGGGPPGPSWPGGPRQKEEWAGGPGGHKPWEGRGGGWPSGPPQHGGPGHWGAPDHSPPVGRRQPGFDDWGE